jgi:uncharacterized protein
MTDPETTDPGRYSAFVGDRLLASGSRRTVLRALKAHHDAGGEPAITFDDTTGKPVDFDLRGSVEAVLARAEGHPRNGPGRPRLGVISREVSLLPRHWEWLERQPNGISAALRRLVDEARKREPDRARARRAREAADRFLWAMGGDRAGCEEASRALYAGDPRKLRTLVRGWPRDVREHLLAMVEEAAALDPAASADGPPATRG